MSAVISTSLIKRREGSAIVTSNLLSRCHGNEWNSCRSLLGDGSIVGGRGQFHVGVTSSLHYRPRFDEQARARTVLRHQVTWHHRWYSKLSLAALLPRVPSSLSCSLPEACASSKCWSAASPQFQEVFRLFCNCRNCRFTVNIYCYFNLIRYTIWR